METICRGLRALIPGRRISQVEVFEPRLRHPVNSRFSSQLPGKTILGVDRRGKYILIPLEGEMIWMVHLGMSGKLIYVEAGQPREKHDHIVIHLENGHELRYHDPRRFGLSLLVPRSELEELPQIKVLGLDPFQQRFNGAYLHSVARSSRRKIRDLLIDQGVVAGIGNIYANEILFRAGVRPTARACKLGSTKAGKIARLIPKVLREAIRWCGTSFSDYRDAEDRYGEFQNHLRVYDREGKKCRVCGSTIKRVPIGNRSAFYCPKCQK